MQNETNNLELAIDLIDETLIRHSQFEYAVARINYCLMMSRKTCDAPCLALVGESRCGKSRTLEHILNKNLPIRCDEGLRVPILRAKVESNPTVKSLAEILLHNLGDPMSEKGTENSKTNRLKKLLIQADTKLLMLDEFQHFCDRKGKKIQHHVADWLKNLVEELQIGLVVSGLPYALAILKNNEQLGRRFLAPIMLKRFDWEIPSERQEFLEALYIFQERLSDFDMPELTSNMMAFRMYCATGGLIGYLVKLLREMVTIAALGNKISITLDDMALAHKNAIWKETVEIENPFDKDLLVNDDMINGGGDRNKDKEVTKNSDMLRVSASSLSGFNGVLSASN